MYVTSDQGSSASQEKHKEGKAKAYWEEENFLLSHKWKTSHPSNQSNL